MGKLQATWPQLKYLAIYGIWPKAVEGTRLRSAIRLWGRLIVSFTIMVISLEFFNLHALYTANEMDLNDFVITMNDILFASQSLAILINILVFEREFEEMMTELEDLLDHSQLLAKSFTGKVFHSKLKICRMAFLAFLSGTLTMSHWGLRPLINRVVHHNNIFVYHTWLPFDVDPWYIYFSVLGFQITVGVSWIVCQPMFASLFVSFTEHILGHIDVLSEALMSLDYSDTDSTLMANQYFNYHQKILKVGYILRNATRVVFLCQFLCVTAIICLNLYEITYVEIDVSRLLNILEETLLELFLIALYCYYCNQLSIRSSEIMDSAYFSGWITATTSQRKSMGIFMAATRIPLSYGGFVKMDWNTFINILKTAFSFYNFLGAIRTAKEGHDTL